MTLPSILGFSKITEFLAANKLVVAGGTIVVIIAVPTTVYLASKQSADKQTSNEQVIQEIKSNNNSTVLASGTSNTQPTENKPASNQNSNSTPQATGNQTPSTGSSPVSNEQPSNATPAAPSNQTPTPSIPNVDWWDIVVTSYSPTNCLIRTSTKCPSGTNVSATVKFVDRNTGDYITITDCSAEGTISSGPQYLTANGGTRFSTQTSKIDSYTCTANFTPPDYGTYGIWLTANTTESINHPQLSNNTKYWQIAP